jgi:hypothetical protein
VMRLSREQAYALLEKYGCYVTEACDKCSQILGPVRYTRNGEAGAWCSRECRGDAKKAVILKPGRPRKYRNEKERRRAKSQQQRVYRSRHAVEKTVCIQSETKDLQAQKPPLSHYPSSGAFGGFAQR